MTTIPLQEAIDRLARTIEQADLDDLVEVFAELHPARPLAEARTANATALAQSLAEYVRTKIEPDEVADLWNVVFSDGPYVYFNEEEEALRPCERGLRSAEF